MRCLPARRALPRLGPASWTRAWRAPRRSPRRRLRPARCQPAPTATSPPCPSATGLAAHPGRHRLHGALRLRPAVTWCRSPGRDRERRPGPCPRHPRPDRHGWCPAERGIGLPLVRLPVGVLRAVGRSARLPAGTAGQRQPRPFGAPAGDGHRLQEPGGRRAVEWRRRPDRGGGLDGQARLEYGFVLSYPSWTCDR